MEVRVGVSLGSGVAEPLTCGVGVLVTGVQVGSGGGVAVTGSGVFVAAGGTGVFVAGGGAGVFVAGGGAGVSVGGAGAGVFGGGGGAVTSTVITTGAGVSVAGGAVTSTVTTTGGAGVTVGGGGGVFVAGSARAVIVASVPRSTGVLVGRPRSTAVLVSAMFAVRLGSGVGLGFTLTAFCLRPLLITNRMRIIISNSAARAASIYCQRSGPVPATLLITVC